MQQYTYTVNWQHEKEQHFSNGLLSNPRICGHFDVNMRKRWKGFSVEFQCSFFKEKTTQGFLAPNDIFSFTVVKNRQNRLVTLFDRQL